MKEIPLTQGKVAIVDDADFERLSEFKWHALRARHTYYASTKHNGRNVKMHRFILEAAQDAVIDHIDQNGLNNQRRNLRFCTKSENAINLPIRDTNTSGFKGVCWRKDERRWIAKIVVNDQVVNLGRFKVPSDAARAYDAAAVRHFGQFAWTNFPKPSDATLSAQPAASEHQSDTHPSS